MMAVMLRLFNSGDNGARKSLTDQGFKMRVVCFCPGDGVVLQAFGDVVNEGMFMSKTIVTIVSGELLPCEYCTNVAPSVHVAHGFPRCWRLERKEWGG